MDRRLGRADAIDLVYVRQERAAIDICDGFARASGRVAVCFTDSGPAAANIMGGMVNSFGDGTPVLFFAGHNERTSVPAGTTKELPFLEVFGPVSKYAEIIRDPSQTAEILRRAFMALRRVRSSGSIDRSRKAREAGVVFFTNHSAASTSDVARNIALDRFSDKGVEIDIEPFYETARLLYEGPWVAERYLVVRPVLASSPDDIHPDSRSRLAYVKAPGPEAAPGPVQVSPRTQGAYPGIRDSSTSSICLASRNFSA